MSEKFMLVATVKDEGPNILEWVAYHRAIGFDTIHIYQNDSFDETQKVLRTLAKMGVIKYFRNDSWNKQWQNKAYRRASFHEDYVQHDWCMTLDGDEFLNIKTGDGSLRALTEKFPDADEIRMNWRNFSCSGHVDLSDDLVIDRYTYSDPEKRIQNHRQGVKTLFRPHKFKRPGIHMPSIPLSENLKVVNGSGIAMKDIGDGGWRAHDPESRKFAQINHYPLRDVSSFLIKSARGSASHVDRDLGLKYWHKFNAFDARDLSIWRQSDRTRSEMAALNAQSRGRLFMLRARALELWQERLELLLENPETQALKAALIETIPVQGKLPKKASAAPHAQPQRQAKIA